MKKNISTMILSGGFALFTAGTFFLSSCEGPAGPPGEDANETCIICHNDQVVLLAKQQQTLSSHHLTGGNYGRNHTDCAVCHTHQGFIETQATGELETANVITDPAPINCRTCHMIHHNYDESDWSLVTTSEVDLRFGDATVDIGGPANLCVNCHQSLPVSPLPVAGGGDVSITSSRYGPHHGPQSNTLWGVGGYELAGSKSYPDPGSHPHANAGCTTCHMAEVPYGGVTAGGHTFNMTYEYHGSTEENINGCTGCHQGLEEFDYNGLQTEVEDLMDQILAIMVTNGWADETGSVNASPDAPLVLTPDQAGAVMNYLTIEADRSSGIHNPEYTVALLTNTLESLSK
jgi:hypothetical protein